MKTLGTDSERRHPNQFVWESVNCKVCGFHGSWGGPDSTGYSMIAYDICRTCQRELNLRKCAGDKLEDFPSER